MTHCNKPCSSGTPVLGEVPEKKKTKIRTKRRKSQKLVTKSATPRNPGDSPASLLLECQAQIVGYTKGELGNFAYVVHCVTPTREWVLYRRFSEFHAFRKTLLQALKTPKQLQTQQPQCAGTCQLLTRAASLTFPRKRLFHKNDNLVVAAARAKKFTVFLESLLLLLHSAKTCGQSRRSCLIFQLVEGFFDLPTVAQDVSPDRRKIARHPKISQMSQSQGHRLFPPRSFASPLLSKRGTELPKASSSKGHLRHDRDLELPYRPLYTILEEQEIVHHTCALVA